MSASGAQRFGCYIGNVDSTVSLDMLKQVFCSCGTILDASLNGRTEDPYRFGFIDFATEEARAKALKYNGFTLVGRKLRVNVSKGNVGKPEGYGNPSPREARQAPPTSFGSAAPAMAGNGLSAAEQQQAQFLLQLIQQGSVDPQTLTEAQRSLLVAALSGGSVGADGAPAASTASAPAMPVTSAASTAAVAAMGGGASMMPGAPQMGMYNPMWGGPGMPAQFGGMPPFGAPMMGPGMMMNMFGQPQGSMQHPRPPRGTPANPSPPEELLKLREIQRRQFLKVIKEETEAYEKMQKEHQLKEDGRSADDSSDSHGEDDDDENKRPHHHNQNGEEKKAKMEMSDMEEGES